MTRPYAEVIGDPIAHSKSPLIHNFWLGRLGIDAEYRACHVRPDELGDYFAQRRGDAAWRGCNVTIPHKVTAMPWLDRIEGAGKGVGAVNCVVAGQSGLLGSNSDVDGIRTAIGHHEYGDVCLFGNGGAARSALWYLAYGNKNARFSHHHKRVVHIVARDIEKSRRLLDEFGLPGNAYGFPEAARALAHAGLVINATSLGMAHQPAMPKNVISDLKRAYADAAVFDMVYNPLETDLLREATRNGFATIDGLTMLIAQAERAFQMFFGHPAPREHDAELRALLTK